MSQVWTNSLLTPHDVVPGATRQVDSTAALAR